MVKHIDILAILFFVWGGFQLFIGLILALIYVGFGAAMGIAGGVEGEEELMITGIAMGAAGLFVSFFVMMFSLPSFAAGIGIRRRRPWGRIVGIVVGALALSSIPLGTALGIYALIVLIDKDVGEAFSKSSLVSAE
jgi:hypothetical protein